MNETVNIPKALVINEAYKALNPQQQESLSKRLSHVSYLANNLMQAMEADELIIESILEDIELDTTAINSAYEDAKTGLSIYAINTMLAADCNIGEMHKHVDEKLSTIIDNMKTIPYCRLGILCEWFTQWALQIKHELIAFSRSKLFDEAMAHLLAINSLMGLMSACTSIARLNPRVISQT